MNLGVERVHERGTPHRMPRTASASPLGEGEDSRLAQEKWWARHGRALGLGGCGWGKTVSAAIGCASSTGLRGV